ncbi:MAG TPA: BatA domain-containing protein [Cyclobacteriaceae bacterium]|nr:BatA domain-containing protein [Cyclobacteriaceae bacterium]
MTFANPSYLWAFAGLAIPLAIHLLSRKEGKVIRVGSLRHVEESNTSQFKSIKLNEIFLLLLRSLMVTMIVLFLAGAQCTNPPGKSDKWLMVESGVDQKADSLEVHPLPEGNYYSVAKKLGDLPNEIVVLSHSRVNKFNGERISLPANVSWITAEQPSKKFAATAWQAGDTVFVRTANSSSIATSFNTSIGIPDSIEIQKPEPIKVSTDNALVVAALAVLKNEFKLPVSVDKNGDQKILVTNNAGPIVERTSANEITIHKLDQDVALNENLVIELFRVLYPNLQEPQLAKNNDARSMPEQLAWSASKSTQVTETTTSAGIEKYLILLFIVSFAAERFVAIRRNQ